MNSIVQINVEILQMQFLVANEFFIGKISQQLYLFDPLSVEANISSTKPMNYAVQRLQAHK